MVGNQCQRRQIGLLGGGQLAQLYQGVAPVVVGGGAVGPAVGGNGPAVVAGPIPGIALPDGIGKGAGRLLIAPLQEGLPGQVVPDRGRAGKRRIGLQGGGVSKSVPITTSHRLPMRASSASGSRGSSSQGPRSCAWCAPVVWLMGRGQSAAILAAATAADRRDRRPAVAAPPHPGRAARGQGRRPGWRAVDWPGLR